MVMLYLGDFLVEIPNEKCKNGYFGSHGHICEVENFEI